jgi:hypothetical protein
VLLNRFATQTAPLPIAKLRGRPSRVTGFPTGAFASVSISVTVDAKRAEKRDGDCPLLGRPPSRLLEQKSDSKRVGLGRRERLEQLVQPLAEQVAEACEGSLASAAAGRVSRTR